MAEQKINLLIGANFASLQNALKDVEGLVGELPGKTKPHFESIGSAIRKTSKDLMTLATTQGATSEAFVDAMGKLQRLKTAQTEFNNVLQQGNTIGNPAATTMQRVGSSYNGLGMSINQLTREMPAFTNSMQTGFMAISNNIPTLVDELGRLKQANVELVASGQPAKSIFKQLASGLFSWQTALSVGITLLTMYGPKLIEWVANLELFKEKIVDNRTELQKYQEVQLQFMKNTAGIKKGIDDVTESITKQNIALQNQLTAKIQGVDVSKVELDNAKALQAAMEKRLEALNLVISGTEKGAIRNAQQIAFQQNALEAQTKLVAQLEKQYQLKTKIDSLDKKKGEVPSYVKFEFPVEEIASKSGLAVGKLNESMLNLKKIGLDSFLTVQNQAGRFKEAMYKIVDEVGGALQQLAVDGFAHFAELAGAWLSGEKVDWGQAAAQMIGQIASTIGKGMIAIGIPMLFSPLTAGEGGLMIAGGAALMAVAGAFGTNKGSSKGSSGGGGSSPSGNYSSNSSALSFRPMSTMIEVGGQVRGNNLKIAMINTDISNRRVK